MPFFVHPANTEPETGTSYAAKSEAIAARTGTETITFVADDSERETWRNRETRRFEDKTYIDVPWLWADWYQNSPLKPLHFAHLSLQMPGMVAYTPTEEHGIQDRQLRVRPAKYLQDFFGTHLTKD